MDADVREFLLTPTLALDDPMGVTKEPSVKRKPLKNKRSSSGFGASKKRGGYERKKSSSEGGENGGGAGIDGEEDDEEEEYTTLHERMVHHVKAGDPVVVILLAIVVYLVFHRAVEHLPAIFACLVTLYGSRVYYKGARAHGMFVFVIQKFVGYAFSLTPDQQNRCKQHASKLWPNASLHPRSPCPFPFSFSLHTNDHHNMAHTRPG